MLIACDTELYKRHVQVYTHKFHLGNAEEAKEWHVMRRQQRNIKILMLGATTLSSGPSHKTRLSAPDDSEYEFVTEESDNDMTECVERVGSEKTDCVEHVDSDMTEYVERVGSEKTECVERVGSDLTECVERVGSQKTDCVERVDSDTAEYVDRVGSETTKYNEVR